MPSEPGNQEWFYRSDESLFGPFSPAQMESLVGSGSVLLTTQVARSVEGPWLRAGEVLNWKQTQPRISKPDGISIPEMVVRTIDGTLDEYRKPERPTSISFRDFLSEAFKRHSSSQIEESIIVGTEKTTPASDELQSDFPKPWIYTRFIFWSVIVFLGFVLVCKISGSVRLVAMVMLISGFAMPVTILVLMWEFNAPRNVSIYRISILFVGAGTIAVLVSILLCQILNFISLGTFLAGTYEELSKLAAIFLFAWVGRYKFLTNGLLFGAAVGAAVGAIENAGYSFEFGYAPGLAELVTFSAQRALLVPFMHVAWTMIVYAALWRAKGERGSFMTSLKQPRFLRVLVLVIILHTVWNVGSTIVLIPKAVLLGGFEWLLIVGYLQIGIREFRERPPSLPT